jgi:hypothetical protein
MCFVQRSVLLMQRGHGDSSSSPCPRSCSLKIRLLAQSSGSDEHARRRNNNGKKRTTRTTLRRVRRVAMGKDQRNLTMRNSTGASRIERIVTTIHRCAGSLIMLMMASSTGTPFGAVVIETFCAQLHTLSLRYSQIVAPVRPSRAGVPKSRHPIWPLGNFGGATFE